MPKFSLPSFAKGELSPELFGRIDIGAYNIGLAEASNVVVHTYGGVSRRPGMRFVGETKNNDKQCRVVPFKFKSTDTYIIEMGEYYFRFIRNDAHVTNSRSFKIRDISYATQATVTAGEYHGIITITAANPAVVTYDNVDGLVEGDTITFADLDDFEELEGQYYTVFNLDEDASTSQLKDSVGSLVDTSALPGSPPTSGAAWVSHGYSDGDDVIFSDLDGYEEIELARWKVSDATTEEFKIKNLITGEYLNTTQFDNAGQLFAGDVVSIYTLPHNFMEEELFDVTYTQSADVMTFAHPNHYPKFLTRIDHDDWTYEDANFIPDQAFPTSFVKSSAGSGTSDRYYKVTAVSAETGEESLPGLSDSSQGLGTVDTSSSPVVVTMDGAYTLEERDEVQIDGTGDPVLDGRRFMVMDIGGGGGDDFQLFNMQGLPVDPDSLLGDVSSGTVTRAYVFETSWSTSSNTIVSWDNVDGADAYNVYRRSGSADQYNWIGDSQGLSFTDGNIAGDVEKVAPKYRDPVPTDEDAPRATGYHEQRLVIGGSDNEPDRSTYSKIGQYNNFARGNPASASDGISAFLPSGQVDVIRHYLSYNNLLIFTEGSEWKVTGDSTEGFNVDTITQRLQSKWGCGSIPPQLIGKTILWVTAGQSNVRAMAYDIVSDTYDSNDVTVLSRHLFKDNSLKDWTWQRYPDSIVFCTRDDGTGLALSFDTEQEVIAWSTLSTDGVLESVETLRQGGTYQEDSNYWVVQRTINGNTVRYIEVSRDTYFDEPEDMFFVDSGITYDGTPTSTLTGAWHLAGASVVAVGDGDYVPDLTVSALGTIELPFSMSKVHVGLSNTVRIKSLPLAGQNGNLIGEFKKISKATIKMYNSRKPWIGPNVDDLVEAKQRDGELWGSPSSLLTGDIEVNLYPSWTLHGQIVLEQPLPIAFNVLNITPTFETINDEDI